MNRIEALVTKIESMENLTIVTFDASGERMVMAGLGLNLPIEEGSAVVLGVKATHVALAREFSGEISIANRLQGVVEAIKMGRLLCSVKLRAAGTLMESVVTAESAGLMELRPGERVELLIEASDLAIVEVQGGKREGSGDE